MDRPKTTPKDFFLWAGAMVSLYAGVIAFIALIFDYVNYVFPDPLQYVPANPYQGSVAYEMASLIVLAPLFLVLMRVIRRDIAAHEEKNDLWVRRWALVFILFVAGATIAIDLIVLITSFLNGQELSARFLFKIAVVLLVAAGGFMHFIADVWGYWEKYPERARSVNYGVGALVVITIFAGFVIIGSPRTARLYQFDAQKITDLQNIQYQVLSYWQQSGKLASSMTMLGDAISGYQPPVDPQSGAAYEYSVMGPVTFQLCAVFNAPSRLGQNTMRTISAPVAYPASMGNSLDDNWPHDQGRVCFLRTIDPNRYPVNKAGPKPTL